MKQDVSCYSWSICDIILDKYSSKEAWDGFLSPKCNKGKDIIPGSYTL